jgi:hypothetical protein
MRPASDRLPDRGTIWLAAQIRTSASHMVARPCSRAPSTVCETPPASKRIGAVRLDLPKRVGHQVLRVPRCDVAAWQSAEQLPLPAPDARPLSHSTRFRARTRAPSFLYRGPPPGTRNFSSVRGDRRTKAAALSRAACLDFRFQVKHSNPRKRLLTWPSSTAPSGVAQAEGAVAICVKLSQQPDGPCVQGMKLHDPIRVDNFTPGAGRPGGEQLPALSFSDQGHVR